ncbi:hypothetical protein [Microvirga terricola]|uniref:Uncharacterized protein n=1 Tax=Microvirga terricola TaxID=2719797 RepID=A0ABX0VCI0_9HYPH|nr:hypothetical protein [Microvirga terricola]NIX77208.1 hypothetical protein [Microvirga terricola]
MWNRLKRIVALAAPPPEHFPERLVLELGGEAIAEIAVKAIDFPWTYGRLLDTSKFERYRPYFTDASSWPDDDQELDQLCSEVKLKGGFHLRCLTTGARFTDVVLNQEDEVVWFRCRPEAGV